MAPSKSCILTALVILTSLQPERIIGVEADPTGSGSPEDRFPYFTKILDVESCEQIVYRDFRRNAMELGCDADGYSKPNITWAKNGRMIAVQKSDEDHNNEWSYVLKDVELSDVGIYECKVCNKLGCINYQYFFLPFASYQQATLLGSEYTLRCGYRNKTKWEKIYNRETCFASVIDKNVPIKLELDENSDIIFKTVSYSDAGIYRCYFREKFYLVELTVLSNWNESESDATDILVIKKSGDLVTLRCAWRNSAVTWTKNGETVNYTGSELELKNLNREDGGLYRCEICSYAKCKEFQFILVIDSVFKEHSMRNKTIDINGNVWLNCETVLSNYNIACTVEYIKYRVLDEDNPIVPSNVTKIDVRDEFTETSVTPNDWYTCVMTSTYGVFYRSAFIGNYIRTPDFGSSWNIHEYYNLKESEIYYIICATNDVISRTWTNDDNLLDDNSLALEIRNATRNDTGVYTCKVCNENGCVERTYWVLVGQLFENREQHMTVNVSDKTNFICIEKYYSFIRKIEWYKITSEHRSSLLSPLHYVKRSNILSLRGVQYTDAGIYQCQVFLKNGIKHMRIFNLTVVDYSTNRNYNSLYGYLSIAIIVCVCTLVAIVSTCCLIMQKRLNREINWIKKVVISKPVSSGNAFEMSEAIPMPIVHIVQQRSKAVRRADPNTDYELPIDTEWEFPRDNLILGCDLGKGAFGKVVRAEAFGIKDESSSSTIVAVKTLREGFQDDDVKDFVYEMEIMKMIGKHPNIINLLGCCCSTGPLYIIVEYAPHGDLKHFLREHHPEQSSEASTSTTKTRKTLSRQQLITFALQIARGMKYLASRKFVHRDLAARNILVSEGYVIKLSDFGLARDVLGNEYYRKTTQGKLPIRWMAPESLEHRLYSTQSDVWSFGVLTWEIMTLGRQPYAGWDGFLGQLEQGKRLEQPALCSNELYQLLNRCWRFEAEERPTFGEIVQNLEETIGVVNNPLYNLTL